MTSWIALVKVAPYLSPVVFGNVLCPDHASRAEVKELIKRAVMKHYPDTVKIVNIAKGSVSVKIDGEWVSYD